MADVGRHLYVMAYSDRAGIHKVGRSGDPSARAGALASGHVFGVRVVCVFPDAGHLEASVHKALSDSVVATGSGREWFRADLPEIAAAVQRFLMSPPPPRLVPSVKKPGSSERARRWRGRKAIAAGRLPGVPGRPKTAIVRSAGAFDR